jgi:sulfur relay (sulfurtransferase) DsrC/TusE family protein
MAQGQFDEARDWHLKGLADMTAELRGTAISEELWLCLRAVDDKLFYAAYHVEEAMRLVYQGLGNRNAQQVMHDVMLGKDLAAQQSFLIARKQAWAHLLASLQNLHSMVDIMGHVLVFALGLQTKGRISMYLARPQIQDPQLIQMLVNWLDHDDHVYLDAAVNFSKHHSLVRESLSVDLTGTRAIPVGLKFESFRYKGRTFPERWVTDALIQIFDRELPTITNVGRRINELLRDELTSEKRAAL